MDTTVNWRFNSNSAVSSAIEFPGFHHYLLAATIENVLVVGYHLKGFLFDGHFPHYISLDWALLNCWDIMRYLARSYWYLEQVWSVLPPEIAFVRHFALTRVLPQGIIENVELFRRNKMSTWNGIFNLDSLNTFSDKPHRHCPQWHDYWIYVLPESREKLIFIKNWTEWSCCRNCCVNVCKFEQNKGHKTFPISPAVLAGTPAKRVLFQWMYE